MSQIIETQVENLSHCQTLAELLQKRASAQPQSQAFTFLDPKAELQFTYAQLDEKAREIALGLLTKVNPGDRVVLLCPPGLDYVSLFYGCLYAGITAVPLYPPRLKQRTDRISKVIASCDANLIVTTDELLESLQAYFAGGEELQGAHLTAIGQIIDSHDNTGSLSPVDSEGLAFIQYTSGSTGTPKGVMVSQSNIMANLRALENVTKCASHDVFVNWLPLFHDLGLINTVMLPVYLGTHSVLMSPSRFVQKPQVWFDAISRFKGTICGAPNFAFELCIAKINLENCQDVDLSSWQLAFNAAEPINPDTLVRFAAKFGAIGFKEHASYPSYGMAEATVFLAGGRGPNGANMKQFDKDGLADRKATPVTKGGQTLVSCGHIPEHHELFIVDPQTATCLPEGNIGEIWVSGPSIAKGYWGLEQRTEETFNAYTEDNKGPFLRTGDLGFISDGELYISGRIKDIMIIRGQNYYPQDVELTAFNSHPALMPNSSAAFTIGDDNDASLVLVQEVKASAIRKINPMDVCAAMRSAIAIEFDLKVDVVLIEQRTLPKTSSGKVQRSLCKKLFEAGQLKVVDLGIDSQATESNKEPVVTTAVEAAVIPLFESVLKVAGLTPQDEFFALGGDSLDATRLIGKIEQNFGFEIALESLYQHSSVSELSAYIEQQSSELAASGSHRAIPVNDSTDAPLSFAQQRLWFLNQIEGQNQVLNLPMVLALKGELDVEKLNGAFNQIIERHDILRTTYQWQDQQASQTINPVEEYQLSVEDLSQKADADAQAQQIAIEEATRQFDLSEGPIFSIRLLKIAEQVHHLLFTIHHISADAWTMDVLIDELTKLYVNEEASLATSNINYSDFAAWQQQNRDNEAAQQHLAYWTEQLADAPDLLALPYDRARPERQTFIGKVRSKALAQPLVDSLQSLSHQHKTTLFVTLLSAFQVQLQRLSGENDIVVGTDVSNRNHPQLSHLMGFFVNQLVLRNKVDSEQSFSAQLDSNREMVLQAMSHQDMPFEQLVDSLAGHRNVSYSPLFQVKFLLNHSPLDALDLPGLDITQVVQEETRSQYDLTLSIDHDKHKGYTANVHYNIDLFDEVTIDDLLNDYLGLLEAAASEPNTQVAQLPCYTTSQDKYQQWGVGETHQQDDSVGISAQIENQAKLTPDATAVVFANEQMTYSQLNQEANRVANFLLDLELEPDSIVGVHFERSINQVVALVALGKIGAGFLPLDPQYPQDRIEHMLSDSDVSYVLCADSEHAHLADYDGGLIELDDERSIVEDEPDNNPAVTINPQHSAYLLYTSGSSGKPKGVQIANSSLLNLCNWYLRFANITSESSVLQPIPLSFDASIKNVLAPLMVGAKLVLPPNGPFDPQVINAAICDHQVNVINCVPSVFYPLMEQAQKDDYQQLKSLSLLALGGEAANLARLKPWLESDNCQCTLANIYGPTECTDISVAYKLDSADVDNFSVMPIGQAIDNAQVYVVNADMSLALPGVIGELLIGGAGVALGYYGQSQMTAQKVIDNPFGEGKVYRSGDLVKWDQNGMIHYQGRCDDQVKVNGVRIETGEIESLIDQINGIKQSSVLQVDNRLVAYLQTEGLTPPTTAQLKENLRKRLPVGWIPKAFVYLDKLPLLPNDKVDHQQLKAIPIPEEVNVETMVAPTNEAEQKLVDAWCEALSIEQCGIDDNFFELGGDSINAVKVVALAEEQQLNFTVADIFEHQTVRALAQLEQSAPVEEQEVDEEEAFDMLDGEDLSAFLDDM